MKRKILFIMNNLTSGGAEKSLISLLEAIDYSLYSVDLLLFKHEGLFLSKIPKQVNLLEEPLAYRYFDMSFKEAILGSLKTGRIDIALSRVFAGYIFKSERIKTRCGQRVWKFISYSLKNKKEQYDAAIGYLEGYPIYFCIDNVKANKKIGFIHTDYDKLGWDPKLDNNYFAKLDHLITVSDQCADILKRRFPMQNRKIEVLYNIISPSVIKKMSEENVDMNHKSLKLVSVGRLSYVKGFDLAIQAAKILVESGHDIKWFIIGEGEEKERLEKMVQENHLNEFIFFLGVKENPYPYIKAADIYVQPSRVEGKSIAIDEAKILQKPIVVTNFDTAKDQITNEVNGLIVEMKASSIFQGIERLINDHGLRSKLITNLSKEKLGTESEIHKLYSLVNC